MPFVRVTSNVLGQKIVGEKQLVQATVLRLVSGQVSP